MNLFLLFFIFCYTSYVLFYSIPKIFAYLFYDTELMAKCYDKDITNINYRIAILNILNIKTYIEYKYNEKGYTKQMFMPFVSKGAFYPVKIRSDKPWKIVSNYDFILGIISTIAIVPLYYYVYFA